MHHTPFWQQGWGYCVYTVYIHFGSKDVRNLGRKLNDWRPPWRRKRLTVRVLNALRIRTSLRLKAFVSVLLIVLLTALLSGCASTPQQCLPLTKPPAILLEPPPPPGAMTDRLEAILKQGQTSEPTSTP